MSSPSSNPRGGRTGLPDRVRDDVPSGAPSGAPHPGPWNPPTGAHAVSEDCVGFRYSWQCGHQQNLLADGNGCLLADDAALINHVHFIFDLGGDGYPCPICPQEELPPPAYYPPVAELPGRTEMDDLQWRLDAMARDRQFIGLQQEVRDRTPAPEPVDPWRREDPPEEEDLWRQIVTLGMRLMEMRREPRGPGSGPSALIAAQPAPAVPQAMAHAPQMMGPGVQTMTPTIHWGQPASPHGMTRRQGSGSSLNAMTAFRGEFVPGQVGWTSTRLSRRQAARARSEWSLAHIRDGPYQVQGSLSQSTAPSQQSLAPVQTRGVLTRAPQQPTRMQEVITAADLDESEAPGGSGGAPGAAGAVRESGEAGGSGAVEDSRRWGGERW